MATEVGYGTVVLAEADTSQEAYEIVKKATDCIEYHSV